jgi:Ca2+-binding RTX toxin-like protein
VVGEGGDDTINASGGNDTIQYSGTAAGFDAITGGAGTDRVVATAANTAIGLSSLATVEEVSAAPVVGSGPLAGVVVRGSEVANTLTFSAVTLTSIVYIEGRGGNDTITDNTSANALYGGLGNDSLNASGGNDRVTGDAGNDFIIPGAGNDLVGYRPGAFGADTVSGFDANPVGGQDLIDVSARGIRAANFASSVIITPIAGGHTRVTIGAGNTITLSGVLSGTVNRTDFVLAP